MLWELGIFDVSQIVRVRLVDDIHRAARSGQVGPAVDAVARAWSEHRRASGYRDTRFDDALHQRALAALIACRAHYTRVRRHSRTPGFDRKAF